MVICASVKQKLSNNAREFLRSPLYVPLVRVAFSPTRKVDEQNEKEKTPREREKRRERKGGGENNRGKSDAFYFEFLRPLNKFAGAPSTVKKFIGRLHALIGDVYRAAIFSSRNTSLARTLLHPFPPSFVSVVDAASARARLRVRFSFSFFLPFFFIFLNFQ